MSSTTTLPTRPPRFAPPATFAAGTLPPDPTPGRDRHPVWPWDGDAEGPADYVMRFWTPILGPSSIALAQALTRRLIDAEADGRAWARVDTPGLAGEVGLTVGGGSNSPMARTMHRLALFGMATWDDTAALFEVRRFWPTLHRGHLRRLAQRAPHLVGDHARWAEWGWV